VLGRVGIEAFENHMVFPPRVVDNNLVHEIRKLTAPPSFVVTGLDLRRGHVAVGKECGSNSSAVIGNARDAVWSEVLGTGLAQRDYRSVSALASLQSADNEAMSPTQLLQGGEETTHAR